MAKSGSWDDPHGIGVTKKKEGRKLFEQKKSIVIPQYDSFIEIEGRDIGYY